VRRAIEWLGGNHGEARRYAAALVARELAENAPAVFNVHVRAFIDAIWAGLRDQRPLVRDASVAALRVRSATLPYPAVRTRPSTRAVAGMDQHAVKVVHGWIRCGCAAAGDRRAGRVRRRAGGRRAWCWWRSGRRATACSGTTACSRRRGAG